MDKNGDFVSGVKHMAAGRLAIELPYVMPDQRTVYITDDGTNVLLGVYKLSTPGDLTCGAVWAAKVVQTDTSGGAPMRARGRSQNTISDEPAARA